MRSTKDDLFENLNYVEKIIINLTNNKESGASAREELNYWHCMEDEILSAIHLCTRIELLSDNLGQKVRNTHHISALEKYSHTIRLSKDIIESSELIFKRIANSAYLESLPFLTPNEEAFLCQNFTKSGKILDSIVINKTVSNDEYSREINSLKNKKYIDLAESNDYKFFLLLPKGRDILKFRKERALKRANYISTKLKEFSWQFTGGFVSGVAASYFIDFFKNWIMLP